MQTNVAQLLKAPVGSIRTFPVDDILEDNGTEYHVKGELTLIRSTNSILVQGRLYTQTEIALLQEQTKRLEDSNDILKLNRDIQKAIMAIAVRDILIKQRLNIDMPNPFEKQDYI